MSADWRNDHRMTKQAEQVSTTGSADTKQQPGPTKRRQYSEALRRQIVAETLEPGSSVSIVARRHDVNANQLFKWRREVMPEQPPEVVDRGAMLPVEIVPAPERRQPRRQVERAGVIEIDLGNGARVCSRGAEAAQTLR